MIKEIKYGGCTTTPDDYLSADGDLTFASGLVQQDGSLHNSPTPDTVIGIPTNFKLIYIHKQPTYSNYIFLSTATTRAGGKGEIVYVNDGADVGDITDPQDVEKYIEDNYSSILIVKLDSTVGFLQATHIGNALCLLATDGNHVAIFKDSNYSVYPTTFPDLEYSASLVGYEETQIYDNRITVSKSDDKLHYDKRIAIQQVNTIEDGSWKPENLVALNHQNYPVGKYRFILYKSLGFKDGTWMWIYVKKSSAETEWTKFYKTKVASGKEIYFEIKEDDYPNGVFQLGLLFRCDGTNDRDCSGTIMIHKAETTNYVIDTSDDVDPTKYFTTIDAAVSKFINENGIGNHRFVYPFFMRVAFKTIDGSYICPSAPMLMIPNCGMVPIVQPEDPFVESSSTKTDSVRLMTSALCCDIKFTIENNSLFTTWKDLITDVVIGVTPQINSYDKSYTSLQDLNSNMYLSDYDPNNSNNFSISAVTAEDDSIIKDEDGDLTFGRYTEGFIYGKFVLSIKDTETAIDRRKYYIHLPEFSNYKDKLTDATNSSFYIINEIPIQEVIDGNWSKDAAGDKILDLTNVSIGDSLVNQKKLTEDYSSLQQYLANRFFAYNGRLHISDYNEKAFGGWPIDMQMDLAKNYGYLTWDGTNSENVDKYQLTVGNYDESYYKCIISFKEGQSTYTCETRFNSSALNTYGQLLWFFYPNNQAFSATVYKTNVPRQGEDRKFYKAVLSLKTHPYMNGSYWFNDFLEPDWDELNSGERSEEYENLLKDWNKDSSYVQKEAVINRQNYLKLSTINNPTVFTDEDTFQFDSRVNGLAAAVHALSTGQKGEFDLYVFTENDGVWSLKINEAGQYVRQIPVTRDILSNEKALISIDNAVVFASQRGLMMLAGSETKCISSQLRQIFVQALDNLPSIASIVGDDMQEIDLDIEGYLQEGSLLYDYAKQRIILFGAESYNWEFVYDIATELWTMQYPKTIDYSVNSYPDAMCVVGNYLLDYSKDLLDSSTSKDGWLVTRPFDMDLPNEFKLIDQIRQNGVAFMNSTADKASHVQQILYGSNDLLNWTLLMSSKEGRMTEHHATKGAFRFFRLAVKTQLTGAESLDSFTVSYRIKESNDKLF